MQGKRNLNISLCLFLNENVYKLPKICIHLFFDKKWFWQVLLTKKNEVEVKCVAPAASDYLDVILNPFDFKCLEEYTGSWKFFCHG